MYSQVSTKNSSNVNFLDGLRIFHSKRYLFQIIYEERQKEKELLEVRINLIDKNCLRVGMKEIFGFVLLLFYPFIIFRV